MRRLAGDDPAVNEEWNCDKGRWGFQYATAFDRHHHPAGARRGDRRAARGDLDRGAARWRPRACATARDGAHGVGVLTGGRLTVEDAYAYAKFARVVLRTNDIDFRARPLVAGGGRRSSPPRSPARTDVTYADVDAAPAVVLVGLEPEEECPILFLRLRKAYSKRKLPSSRSRRS